MQIFQYTDNRNYQKKKICEKCKIILHFFRGRRSKQTPNIKLIESGLIKVHFFVEKVPQTKEIVWFSLTMFTCIFVG